MMKHAIGFQMMKRTIVFQMMKHTIVFQMMKHTIFKVNRISLSAKLLRVSVTDNYKLKNSMLIGILKD